MQLFQPAPDKPKRGKHQIAPETGRAKRTCGHPPLLPATENTYTMGDEALTG